MKLRTLGVLLIVLQSLISFGQTKQGPTDVIGGLTATTMSTGTVVNVQHNIYGFNLIADGSTDNCSVMNSLLAAVPAYSTLYFPYSPNIYHFAITCNSGFGIIINKDGMAFKGDLPAWWTGSTMHGSVVDVPITFNAHLNPTVRNVATDCRTMGATTPCDGISSGAAVTTAGGMDVDGYTYVGTYTTNPAHCVLVQSGPHNSIKNVRCYSVFHALAVRSSDTLVDTIHATDAFDVVVKSDVGSGTVSDVNINNVICDTSVKFTGKGCQLVFTSNANTVSTLNINVNNITFDDAPYNVIINPENGGVVENINVSNVTGFVSTGANYYSFTTTSGVCSNINFTNGTFLNSSGVGFQNTASCVNMNPNNVRINGSFVDDQHIYHPLSGFPSLLHIPVADGHESDVEIAGQNAAASINWWYITKGGNALFRQLNFGTAANSTVTQVEKKIAMAGCTTAASIGGICSTDITVTWPDAFADTNYVVSCVPSGAPTNIPGAPYVVAGSKLAGSVHINYQAHTAAAASWAAIDCRAEHP